MLRYIILGIAILWLPYGACYMAQETGSPLWLVRDGYLYSWTANNGLEQITTEDYISDLALSADGLGFAFIRQSREHPSTNGWEAGDILQTSHICLWQDGASECITEASKDVILRRHLQWHPNNTLTWVEDATNQDNEFRGNLVVYDLNRYERYMTQLSLLVVDAGNFDYGDYRRFHGQFAVLSWPSQTVTLHNFQTGEEEFRTYFPQRYLLGSAEEEAQFMNLVVAQHPEQDVLYFLYCNAFWVQVDVENSVWDKVITIVPEIAPYFGLLADIPDAHRIELGSHSCDYDVEDRASWDIVAADGHILDTIESHQFYGTHWQLSPDGQLIAYITEDGVVIWHDGFATLIDGTAGVSEMIWSSVGWRVGG